MEEGGTDVHGVDLNDKRKQDQIAETPQRAAIAGGRSVALNTSEREPPPAKRQTGLTQTGLTDFFAIFLGFDFDALDQVVGGREVLASFLPQGLDFT